MKLRSAFTVLGTAALTAALTLALLAPRGGDAQAGAAVQPVIAQPQLTYQGCTFTLKTDKSSYEAGESPQIEVTATNPTDKSVTASVWVTVTTRAPTKPVSRMLSIPTPLWSHEYAFTLPPDGTKTLTEGSAALPAGEDVNIVMIDQNTAVLMSTLDVPAAGGPNAQQNAAPPVAKK